MECIPYLGVAPVSCKRWLDRTLNKWAPKLYECDTVRTTVALEHRIYIIVRADDIRATRPLTRLQPHSNSVAALPASDGRANVRRQNERTCMQHSGM